MPLTRSAYAELIKKSDTEIKLNLRYLALAGLIVTLPACSSIIEGTSQEILVNTNPSGANCELIREGQVIGRVSPTPGAITIKKTKHDITMNCSKDGYEVATYINKSDVAGATVGNILLGGGIGWAIDSASGADNKYTSPVNVTLTSKQQQAQPATATGSGSAAGQPSS